MLFVNKKKTIKSSHYWTTKIGNNCGIKDGYTRQDDINHIIVIDTIVCVNPGADRVEDRFEPWEMFLK